ncbi:MAG: hypothetical protein JOY79_06330 [Acidobacteriaceae bacterium]|nr:hypothetical protein [Acidobacteriaceae bacterium]
MKIYRSPRDVLAEINALISKNKPSSHGPSLLVQVARLLHDTRNYYRVGIYLVVNDRVVRQAVCGPELPQAATATTRAEAVSAIKTGTQTLGYVRAEGEHTGGAGLPPEDRVLIKEVAVLLSLYLHGKGRYLMRKAREVVREAASAVVEDRARPVAPSRNEAPKRASLGAAAGEKVSA